MSTETTKRPAFRPGPHVAGQAGRRGPQRGPYGGLASHIGWLVVVIGCSKQSAPPVELASAEAPSTAPAAAEVAAPGASAPGVGQLAPDFTLPDLDGNQVSLSQFRGKLVVLEWFNPGCPFVRASHTVGSLKGLAEKHSKDGVVWLAINSAGPGKQGHGAETNRERMAQFGMHYPLLLDESGHVGRLYGAKRTPHLYVIDPEGRLVYRGAIDNSPDGEGAEPEGGKLVNYVDVAIAAVRTGAKVEPAETKAYGCTVKYKDL